MPDTTARADIGLIGLAVMGQNLVLNMNDHGFTVAVFNRTVSKVDEFLANEAKGTKVVGAHSLEEFVATLKKPRRVMLMVKAGKPVDDFIETLLGHLEKGDIIIDGGNSNFNDTSRRTKYLAGQGPAVHRDGRLRRRGRARGTAPASCPAAAPAAWPHGEAHLPGHRRARWTTASPAATGWARAWARATSSRWCTTASSTATCSSSARPTALMQATQA